MEWQQKQGTEGKHGYVGLFVVKEQRLEKGDDIEKIRWHGMVGGT